VDRGDINLGRETDRTSIEVDSEADVQDETQIQDEYSDGVHYIGNWCSEMRSEDQGEETDFDENQLIEPIAQRAGELQKSRKRAGSALSGGRKSWKRT